MNQRPLFTIRGITVIRAVFSFFLLLFLSSSALLAQDSNLSCNTFTSTNWISPTFSLTTNSVWTNSSRVTDDDASNFANTSANGAILRIGDDVTYSSAGYYVGVHVGRPALTSGGNVTVRTMLNSTQQDTYTVNVAGTALGSQEDIGFYATKPFNAIEIVNGSGNTIRVYYVFLQRYCAYDLNLTCNTYTPLSRPNFASYVGDATGVSIPVINWVSDADNAVDSDPDNSATIFQTTGTATFAVVNPVVDYPASTTAPIYAGFDIQRGTLIDVSLLGGITVSTYLNGNSTPEETASGNSLLLGLSLLGGDSGRQNIGFAATKPFDEVRISFSATISLGTVEVFSAIIKKFCEGPEFACNTNTYLNESTHPLMIDPSNTNITGVACVNCAVGSTSNAIDGDTDTEATVDVLVSVGTIGSLAVKNPLSTFPVSTTAPYFVGFDIENPNLVGANLLTNVTVKTLDANGTTVQSVDASNGLLSVTSSVLSGSGRQTLGFLATQPFTTLKIEFTNTIALKLGETKIYNAVIKRFCPATEIACKDMTELTNPTYPVYVNSSNTGIGSLGCVGCSINNIENVVSATATTPTTIIMATGIAASAQLSVANAIEEYPAGTFAGFDIGSATLANINLLSSVQITLYNNGTAVQSGTGTSLLAGANVLTGDRQIVGTVAQVPFDEIQIVFNQTGVNLGTISIYKAVVQTSCETAVTCNETIYWNTGTTSAVIEGTRTGVTGLASIGALGSGTSITDPWAVVSPSTTDYARIGNVLAVDALSQASISVADPSTVYPTGTYAGFTIRKGDFLVAADLLPYLTITTYLDGQLQESRLSGNLLDLTVIINIFGTPDGYYNVGFVATKPFDEIQLSLGTLVNANVTNKYIDVFGAFADTRYSSNGGSLVCNYQLNPDFAVTTQNEPTSGNVSTNDIVPSGTTYGTPTAASGNPTGATITMTPDGAYSFTATTPGTYTYTVPVCAPGQSSDCPTSPLIITVIDPTSATDNKPVVNPDYASVQSTTATPSDSSVTINVKANDGPGNAGGTLGIPTITTTPSHGTATVDGSGNVVYTPASNYIGDDEFTYEICETPSGLCNSATVTIHVVAPGSSTVTVMDDFAQSKTNTPVSGNVLTNDIGSGLTVSNAGTITNASGSLVLGSNGAYTFTPATGVTGPVDFTYTACDNSTPSVCGTATLHILVTAATSATTVLNPDFAVTIQNVPTSGNVSTNDIVPSGTTYGTPTAAGGNPSGATITMTPDGAYSFTATTPGTYTYTVPVCAPDQSSDCPTSPLIITVNDPTSATANYPIANPDYASVPSSTATAESVTINVIANDSPGNAGGTLGTPTIVTAPTHGSAIVNGSGNIEYTPATNYIGDDEFTYEICETPSGLCQTATVIVHVVAPGSSTVTVLDDFIQTKINTSVSGNVLTNDIGSGLTVSNAGTTVSTSGTLVIGSDGAYTFTPATGVTGPTAFTYTACDNSTPSVCGTATLHLLVQKAPDLAPIMYVSPTRVTDSSPITVVVNVFELVGVPTNGTITLRITKDPSLNLNFTSGATNIAGHPVQNSAWTFDNTDDSFYIFTTNQTIQGGSLLPLGMTGTLSLEVSSGELSITALVSGGGEVKLSNNSDSESVDYFQQ